MPKARGSAILIAIMLVTAIGTIGFAFGRVLLQETATANLYENGVGAYYAAESGIEEGFLRYRYNRNEEVPFVNWKLGETKVSRSNLTDRSYQMDQTTNDGIDRLTNSISDSSKQFYDLRMGFIGYKNKWPFFGYDTDSDGQLMASDMVNPSAEFLYQKDQSLNISFPTNYNFFNSPGNDLTLFAKFGLIPKSKSIVEAKVIVKKSGGIPQQYKKMITYDLSGTMALLSPGGDSASFIAATNGTNCSTDGSTNCAWQAASLITSITGAIPDLNSEVTLQLTPLYSDAYLELTNANCPTASYTACDKTKITVMPGPYTTISSAGYYGGATRTIEANIDRQSGSLYDLFDYVIYKAK